MTHPLSGLASLLQHGRPPQQLGPLASTMGGSPQHMPGPGQQGMPPQMSGPAGLGAMLAPQQDMQRMFGYGQVGSEQEEKEKRAGQGFPWMTVREPQPPSDEQIAKQEKQAAEQAYRQAFDDYHGSADADRAARDSGEISPEEYARIREEKRQRMLAAGEAYSRLQHPDYDEAQGEAVKENYRRQRQEPEPGPG